MSHLQPAAAPRRGPLPLLRLSGPIGPYRTCPGCAGKALPSPGLLFLLLRHSDPCRDPSRLPHRVSFELVGEVFESPAPEPILPMDPGEHATVPAASGDCFVLAEGVLMFRPERWDGGRVLRVPEEVGGHTVTAIGPGCFRDCDLLTTIELPNTVKLISPEAFAGCTELRGLFVPEGVGSIGEDAFAGCTALESIYIPASVDHIAKGCFDDCAGLLYIFYESSFEHWNGLYSDYINPFTAVICIDGNYRHGVTE